MYVQSMYRLGHTYVSPHPMERFVRCQSLHRPGVSPPHMCREKLVFTYQNMQSCSDSLSQCPRSPCKAGRYRRPCQDLISSSSLPKNRSQMQQIQFCSEHLEPDPCFWSQYGEASHQQLLRCARYQLLPMARFRLNTFKHEQMSECIFLLGKRLEAREEGMKHRSHDC